MEESEVSKYMMGHRWQATSWAWGTGGLSKMVGVKTQDSRRFNKQIHLRYSTIPPGSITMEMIWFIDICYMYAHICKN